MLLGLSEPYWFKPTGLHAPGGVDIAEMVRRAAPQTEKAAYFTDLEQLYGPTCI